MLPGFAFLRTKTRTGKEILLRVGAIAAVREGWMDGLEPDYCTVYTMDGGHDGWPVRLKFSEALKVLGIDERLMNVKYGVIELSPDFPRDDNFLRLERNHDGNDIAPAAQETAELSAHDEPS